MEQTSDSVGRAERARRGDQAEWVAIYREAYPRLLAYARHRLGGLDEAREAVSETMTRAVASIGSYARGDDGITPWLFGILRHVVVDTQRRQWRFLPQDIPDHPADLPDPVEQLVQLDEASSLHTAFGRLDPDERELLELRVLGGLSSEEVAIALGKKPSAVRMAQMRALNRLRTFVEEAARVG